jgi:hypothetical protein
MRVALLFVILGKTGQVSFPVPIQPVEDDLGGRVFQTGPSVDAARSFLSQTHKTYCLPEHQKREFAHVAMPGGVGVQHRDHVLRGRDYQ